LGFKVLSAEISHETNTFSIHPTGLKSFQDRYFLDGERAIADRGQQNTELAGLLDAARAHDWTVDHVLSAAAGPGGPVTRSAFDALVDPLVAAASKGGFDGVLLILHGAMVTEFCEDGEGEILDRLRAVAGPTLPIAVTLDPHANVTEKMCAQADILVSFTTYPHVDMRATGRRVSELLQRTMLGEIKPKTLRVHRPMLEEVNGGRTDIGPMIDRHALARAHEASRDIFAISINGGFASADIAEVGPTVLVTYDGQPERPLEIANAIADDIWNCRHDILNDYISVQDAARVASGWDGGSGPLVIADYADNPGAGAYGDGTALLAALIEADVEEACFGPLIDGEAAKHLAGFDVGDTARLDIGGFSAVCSAVSGRRLYFGSAALIFWS
jgi:microcystin degradation protein MlrC